MSFEHFCSWFTPSPPSPEPYNVGTDSHPWDNQNRRRHPISDLDERRQKRQKVSGAGLNTGDNMGSVRRNYGDEDVCLSSKLSSGEYMYIKTYGERLAHHSPIFKKILNRDPPADIDDEGYPCFKIWVPTNCVQRDVEAIFAVLHPTDPKPDRLTRENYEFFVQFAEHYKMTELFKIVDTFLHVPAGMPEETDFARHSKFSKLVELCKRNFGNLPKTCSSVVERIVRQLSLMEDPDDVREVENFIKYVVDKRFRGLIKDGILAIHQLAKPKHSACTTAAVATIIHEHWGEDHFTREDLEFMCRCKALLPVIRDVCKNYGVLHMELNEDEQIRFVAKTLLTFISHRSQPFCYMGN